MSSSRRTLTLIALLGACLAGSALAQQASAPVNEGGAKQEQRVDRREARQGDRIAAGAASGQLTAHEQRRLQRQQRRTQHLEQHAEADGKVTGKEALRMERRQDRNSRAIARQKHDAQQQATGQ